jgi:hypothetical protein
MKKVRQARLFSVALILMFLATSTLTRVVAGNDAGDFHVSSCLQPQSDNPYSSDQQFPFEEKEKEFEDKSETTDKDETHVSNLFFICEISMPRLDVATDFNRTISINLRFLSSVPIFLSNRTILI